MGKGVGRITPGVGARVLLVPALTLARVRARMEAVYFMFANGLIWLRDDGSGGLIENYEECMAH